MWNDAYPSLYSSSVSDGFSLYTSRFITFSRRFWIKAPQPEFLGKILFSKVPKSPIISPGDDVLVFWSFKEKNLKKMLEFGFSNEFFLYFNHPIRLVRICSRTGKFWNTVLTLLYIFLELRKIYSRCYVSAVRTQSGLAAWTRIIKILEMTLWISFFYYMNHVRNRRQICILRPR